MDQFHRKVGLWSETGVCCTRFVDLSDPGVLQSPERLRLLLETEQGFRCGHAGADHLKGDPSPRAFLFGFVDNTHATLAHQTQNAVATYFRRMFSNGFLIGASGIDNR